MADAKYRVGIVGGAGTWGRFYLRAYAAHPDCKIVGLVDRARERRDDFAKRYNVDAVFDTVEQLLEAEVPDIVSAIVPVDQNYPTVVACAEAGVKAVSCEKPISAELAEADAMVNICRDRGTQFGCGMAGWATPYMPEVVEWVRDGNIGQLTAAAIPGGLPIEVSGAGCVQLTAIRILTGMEVEWVEGYTLPEEPGYVVPGTPKEESEVPAYGRLGMSGGIVCEIAKPDPDGRVPCFISVEGENGHAWLSRPQPVLIQGKGASSTPVYPEFLERPWPNDALFLHAIERLMRACDSGDEPFSSGHDFRQTLEIAIALVRSACNDHQRIALPLEDRSAKLYPHPYRLKGGDVAGWKSIGYKGPPAVV